MKAIKYATSKSFARLISREIAMTILTGLTNTVCEIGSSHWTYTVEVPSKLEYSDRFFFSGTSVHAWCSLLWQINMEGNFLSLLLSWSKPCVSLFYCSSHLLLSITWRYSYLGIQYHWRIWSRIHTWWSSYLGEWLRSVATYFLLRGWF